MSTGSHKLGGSASGVIAYLQEPEACLGYYGIEGVGFDEVWGKGALSLGIERGISREQFTRMFNGQHPDTGEQLARVRHKTVIHEDGTVEKLRDRTPMIDIVYGTPKSVGEFMVSATPAQREQIAEVAKAAAKAAFEMMEKTDKLARVPTRVKAFTRSDGRTTTASTKRAPAELICVPVVQFSARNTDITLTRGPEGEGLADVHLHVHAPIFTLCGANGRWYTADEHGMKNEASAKLRDSVFMRELARGLEAMGIEIEYDDFDRSRKGEISWEIAGSNEAARRYWSTNTQRANEIRREYEEDFGKPMAEEDLKATLYKTRKIKTKAGKEQDSNPVWELWENDLRGAGIEPRSAEVGAPIEHNVFEEADLIRSRLLGERGLCRTDNTFSGSDVWN